MNILALDASTESISLCAVRNKGTIFNYSYKQKYGASHIITRLGKLLKKHSLTLRQFDAFLIGRGPGSFTGLRISFSIVKAFGFALKRNVFAVDSFASIAYQVKDKGPACSLSVPQAPRAGACITVVSDARRDLVYVQSFTQVKGKLKSKNKAFLCKAHQCVAWHKASLFVAADETLYEKIRKDFPDLALYKKCLYPQAKELIMLFKEGYSCIKAKKNKVFEPLYAYPDDCQVKKI